MNYLAHLALSHFDPDVMLGNFIGDCVKGSDYERYSPRVRMGLLLHRQIDYFTDTHAIAKETSDYFRPLYRHYAGILCDMTYDHFLAANWIEVYPNIELHRFVAKAQKVLLINYFRMPGKMRKLLPFLIKSRRLEDYSTTEGLGRALSVMTRNTSLPDHTKEAVKIVKANYDTIRQQFFAFYKELQTMVDNKLRDVPIRI